MGEGALLDLLRHVHDGSDFAYRYLPVWQAMFFGLALIFCLRVYCAWKARGGDADKCRHSLRVSRGDGSCC